MAKTPPKTFEYIEPIGKRVLVRKDDHKGTKGGIALPDNTEIPTITGRIVTISTQVANDADIPVRQYERVSIPRTRSPSTSSPTTSCSSCLPRISWPCSAANRKTGLRGESQPGYRVKMMRFCLIGLVRGGDDGRVSQVAASARTTSHRIVRVMGPRSEESQEVSISTESCRDGRCRCLRNRASASRTRAGGAAVAVVAGDDAAARDAPGAKSRRRRGAGSGGRSSIWLKSQSYRRPSQSTESVCGTSRRPPPPD